MYKVPNWYKNKRLDLATITDQQLDACLREVQQMVRDNQNIYQAANKRKGQLEADAIALFGANRPIPRAIHRTGFQEPPKLMKEYVKFRDRVHQARKVAAQRQKRREYQKRYYARQKQEWEDRVDSCILEGASEADLYSPELTEMSA